MSQRLPMGDLVTRGLRRCDKENDGSISPAESFALMSEQYGELWQEVADTGSRYFETMQTIVATGASSYPEPDDLYSTVGIDFVDGTGRRRSLIERMAQEREQCSSYSGDAREYALVDDQLLFYPQPSSGTYEWLYIPQPTDLTTLAATDIVDVVNAHGLAFMVWGFAVKALAKSEKTTDGAVAERESARGRLVASVRKRSMYAAKKRIIQREYDGGLEDW